MSSLLWEFPDFKRHSKKLGCKLVKLWMHSYGAETAKGTKLWGNVPYISKLGTVMTHKEIDAIKGAKQTTTTTTKRDGSRSVSGGKDLKNTQAYPVMFGVAIASLHDELLKETDAPYDCSDSDSSSSDDSVSCLDDVFREYVP